MRFSREAMGRTSEIVTAEGSVGLDGEVVEPLAGAAMVVLLKTQWPEGVAVEALRGLNGVGQV